MSKMDGSAERPMESTKKTIVGSNGKMTPSTLNGGTRADDEDLLPIHKDLRRMRESEETQTSSRPAKKNAKEKPEPGLEIPSEPESNAATTTETIERTNVKRHSQGATEIIPNEDLKQLSETLKREGLGSVRLMNDSAKQLFKLMNGLVGPDDHSKADAGVRLLDVDRVKTATECARQITQVVKTQVEVLRFLKECQ